MNAGKCYSPFAEERAIIKGGFVEVIASILSLLLLTGGLMGLRKILKFLFLGAAKRVPRG